MGATSKPLVITGQAYWGEHSAWTRARAEEKLKDFLDEFDDFDRIAGLNWWNFAADKAMSQIMVDHIRDANLDQEFGGGQPSEQPTSGDFSSSTPAVVAAVLGSGLHWIAAEGLKFRTSPDNSDADNVVAELDYGSSAYVKGNETANGYLPVTVPLDGTDTDGFLFANYLRKNEQAQVERAIQEAVSEWLRFDKGAGLEYKSPYSGYINEMWTARGYPDLTGEDRGWFWSAAFISWILENAGYTRTKFDIRHSTYIHESIQNRVLGRSRDFTGYRLDEVRPQVGDILCQWRGDFETTYDQAETQSRFESHTDIVIAVRDRAIITLGGNVANAASNGAGVSVETKTFRLHSNGLLVDERRLFAVMKNQFRPKSEQTILV